MAVCMRCGSRLPDEDGPCPVCGESDAGAIGPLLTTGVQLATNGSGRAKVSTASYVPAREAPTPEALPVNASGPVADVMDDTLLADMLSRWHLQRNSVFQQIDAAVREGVTGVVRSSREALDAAQVQQRQIVERLLAERQAALVEVARLRTESDQLRAQLERARSELAEAEKMRHAAEQIRLAVLRDAQTHREALSAEVERLMGHLSAIRRVPPAERGPAAVADEPPPVLPVVSSEPVPTADVPKPASNGRPVAATIDATGRFLIRQTDAEAQAPTIPESLPDLGSLQPTARAGARTEPETPAPPPRAAEAFTTTVVVRGLPSLAAGMLVRRALKSVAGVISLSFPQFRDGTLTMQVHHELGIELAEAVCQISDPQLAPAGTISDAQMEFEANAA